MNKHANRYRKVVPTRADLRAEMNARELSRGCAKRARHAA